MRNSSCPMNGQHQELETLPIITPHGTKLTPRELNQVSSKHFYPFSCPMRKISPLVRSTTVKRKEENRKSETSNLKPHHIPCPVTKISRS
ncbi:conserved hypothetical protein [Ricinus communis]|uniref:Uncharacterized protein n=1 Tax=Ricinus communis TaxID=3988 RepID=B9RRP9_RICCO|nr:conserved hypothetical protein [Ricinus communis]